MPWPGAPKSQQTPALNPPSVRYPSRLTENSSPGEVAAAVNKAFEGLTVHEQAFANIPAQVASAAATAASDAMSSASETVINNTGTTGVTAFNGATGPITYFPSLGVVNDQLGNPIYVTTQADCGAKIIVGDSSTFTVTLSQEVISPWFAIIDNDSSATAILSSDSGASVYGETTIPGGGFGIVFFDGAAFWSGATQGSSGGSGNLGGSLTSGNVALGPGAGTGAVLNLVSGLDGNHEIEITTGSAPTANGIIWTVTFTASRGHNTFPIINLYSGYSYTNIQQVVGPGGNSATFYRAGAGPVALAAATTYAWTISCP